MNFGTFKLRPQRRSLAVDLSRRILVRTSKLAVEFRGGNGTAFDRTPSIIRLPAEEKEGDDYDRKLKALFLAGNGFLQNDLRPQTYSGLRKELVTFSYVDDALIFHHRQRGSESEWLSVSHDKLSHNGRRGFWGRELVAAILEKPETYVEGCALVFPGSMGATCNSKTQQSEIAEAF